MFPASRQLGGESSGKHQSFACGASLGNCLGSGTWQQSCKQAGNQRQRNALFMLRYPDNDVISNRQDR